MSGHETRYLEGVSAFSVQPLTSTSQATPMPSTGDWEGLRPIITQLYINEERTLKDVMRIMADEYSHKATTKMYKSRLTKYGLSKNNNARDMSFVLRKRRQLDARGEISSFMVGGKRVSRKEIERYVQRKKVRDGDFDEAPADALTPVYIRCITPPSNPAPREPRGELIEQESRRAGSTSVTSANGMATKKKPVSLSAAVPKDVVIKGTQVLSRITLLSLPFAITPPQVFLKHEALFTNISNYVSGCIEAGTWSLAHGGELTLPKQTVCPIEFQRLFWEAAMFFQKGHFVQGGFLANRAFSLLRVIICEESPRALREILVVNIMLSTGWGSFAPLPKLRVMLQDYLGQLAATVLPQRHIWRDICISLSTLDPSQVEELMQSWRCLTDFLGRSIGEFSYDRVSNERDLILRGYFRDLEGGIRRLWILLEEYRRTISQSDYSELLIVERLAGFLVDHGEYLKARALLEATLVSASQSSNPTDIPEARLRLELAEVQYVQGQYDVAEKNVRDAIAVLARLDGPRSALTIGGCAQLEGWLREWGRGDEADKLLAAINGLIVHDA